ncbi:MAG: glucose-6-phosphate isomerase [Desulfonauticus sp.]|nr:glucose-6-phosphate isomerase [Desulfonauticus sp.]
MGFLNWHQAYAGGLKQNIGQEKLYNIQAKLQQEYSNLPFLNLKHLSELIPALQGISSQLTRFKNMLILGIGGSALGPKALQQSFYPTQNLPEYKGKRLYVLDNIYPGRLEQHLTHLAPEDTVVVVISKSGTTLETISQYFLVKKWLQKNRQQFQKHLVIVTDPQKGFLRQEVKKNGYLSLTIPPKLGGRYSILSAVGLLPASFLGLNYLKLIEGAKSLSTIDDLLNHPALKLACWAFDLIACGKNELIFFNYIPYWECWGEWFAQLWAESLGKNQTGSMPIPAIGVRDQHSLLQMFMDGPQNKGCLFLNVEKLPQAEMLDMDLPEEWKFLENKSIGDIFLAESIGTLMSLGQKMPLVELTVEQANEYELGKLILLLELTTLLTGWLLDINPLNQPGVEKGKRLAKAKLGAPGFVQEQKELEHFQQQKKNSQGF